MTSRSERIETWDLPLVSLYDTLSQEALRHPRRWACRKLPRGALVCAMLEASPLGARLVVRIARATKPADDAEWRRELKVFERFLCLDDPPWRKEEEADAIGVAVRYVERVESLDEPDDASLRS